MTLDELLTEAKRLLDVDANEHVNPGDVVDVLEMARSIINLLGEAQPCGVEELPISMFFDGSYGVQHDAALWSSAEIRALCAMYLRAADKVDELNKARGKT